MRLLNVEIIQSDGDAAVAARFIRDGAKREDTMMISVPERHYDMLTDRPDVFLPALMLPCMQTGEALDMGVPVSPRLLSQLQEIQEIFLSWFPKLKPVEVIASESRTTPEPARGTGAFFSAGADSFHTLHEAVNGKIRGVDGLDYLVFVRSTAGPDHRGFGRPLVLGESNESAGLEAELEQVASSTGTVLVRIDTNIQALFTNFNWSLYHHGAGLASIALALSRRLGTQIISSGWSYRDVHPWGSHPATDPLWSTEYLRIIHYGNHVTRPEKIASVIAHDELALRHLRVCTYNSSITNCGHCYKCLRTMIPLDMVGKLSSAATFPPKVPDDISIAFVHDEGEPESDPLYMLAKRLGHDRYERKIRAIIDRRNRMQAMRRLLESVPLFRPAVEPIRVARRLCQQHWIT